MAHWLSAEDICVEYAVQPKTLALYSSRGNLAFRMTPHGKKLFDAGHVAKLFPSRSQKAMKGNGISLGTLGSALLGSTRAKTIIEDSGVQISRIGKLNRKTARPSAEMHRTPASIKKIA